MSRPAASDVSERARRAGAAYVGPGSAAVPRRGSAKAPIAFTSGLPDPSLHPARELAEAVASVLRGDADPALQYGGTQGFVGLREWLACHGSDKGRVDLSPDHYCLTNGSAGALVNVCETFLDPGDTALVESLSFPLSVRAIRSITSRVEPVPVDAGGVDVDALESRLVELAARGERARLLYTIPTFHNPTGSTLVPERRVRLLELCHRHGVLVVEDDAYAELWFRNEPPPSLYALSGGVGVIKLGTFSKILAPGLRVGWCQASPEVITSLVATRCDMGQSPLLLRALHLLGQSGFVEHHVAAARAAYARKAEAMLEALGESCGALCQWKRPQGGFFVWARVAEEVDPLALADTCQDEGVTFVGGHVFAADQAGGDRPWAAWEPGGSRHLRLAFSYVALEEIPEGVRRLGRALQRAAGRA